MATVPEQQKPTKIVATAGQTIFTYPFQILEASAITVWLTPVDQTPDPTADLLVLDQDYTVNGVGNETGGQVILINPADAGDIITEERNTIIQRATDFSVAGEFTADAINLALNRLIQIDQEIQNDLDLRALTYQPTDVLGDNREDNILPVLEPNSGNKISIWSKAAGGALVALQIDEGDDVNTLRSELASQTNGSDGALLVGYFDSIGGGKTVKTKLDELSTAPTDLAANGTHGTCGARLVGYNADSNATNVRDELDVLGNTRAVPLTAVLNGAIYEVTLPTDIFPFTSYNEDSLFKIKWDSANAGAVDLDINSIGAKDLRDMAGDELIAADLEANTSALVYFDSTADQFRIVSQLGRNIDNWATKTEVQNDSAIQKGVYLANFKDHPGMAKAWAVMDLPSPGGPSLAKTYNISGVTALGGNRYRIDFSGITMATPYVVQINSTVFSRIFHGTETATSFVFENPDIDTPNQFHITIFGDDV